MNIAADMHDSMLVIVQDVITELIKRFIPENKGYILFSVSKFEFEAGPRTALLTNLSDYHSVKVMMEMANQHVQSRTFAGEAKREKGELWVQSPKISKTV